MNCVLLRSGVRDPIFEHCELSPTSWCFGTFSKYACGKHVFCFLHFVSELAIAKAFLDVIPKISKTNLSKLFLYFTGLLQVLTPVLPVWQRDRVQEVFVCYILVPVIHAFWTVRFYTTAGKDFDFLDFSESIEFQLNHPFFSDFRLLDPWSREYFGHVGPGRHGRHVPCSDCSVWVFEYSCNSFLGKRGKWWAKIRDGRKDRKNMKIIYSRIIV